MGKADESMYAVNLTGNQTTTPDSSVLLLSPSTHGDSPLLDTSLNTTVKRKRRHKHSYISDQIDNAPHSKRFNSSINENENELDDDVVKGKLLVSILKNILIHYNRKTTKCQKR
jgi:hypothetical protein